MVWKGFPAFPADRRVPAELGQESQASSSLRKGTPLASRVAQGVSGTSSSCVCLAAQTKRWARLAQARAVWERPPGSWLSLLMGTSMETKRVGIRAPIRVAASQKNAVVQPRGEVRGEPENWFGRMF